MKKLISLVLAVVMILAVSLCFVSCAKGECDLCGEEARLKKAEVLGKECQICSECAENLDALGELFD